MTRQPRHAGQWILMRVTEFNDHEEPAAGHIVGTWAPGKQGEKTISRKFARLAHSPECHFQSYMAENLALAQFCCARHLT